MDEILLNVCINGKMHPDVGNADIKKKTKRYIQSPTVTPRFALASAPTTGPDPERYSRCLMNE